MPITFEDLLSAYEFVNLDQASVTLYIGKQTGTVYAESDAEELQGIYAEVPDDVEDTEKYARLPNRYDLDLGKQLPQDFAHEFLPDDADDVRAMLNQRGGYRKFRSLITVRGVLDDWYKFEADTTERALRDWCEGQGIAITP